MKVYSNPGAVGAEYVEIALLHASGMAEASHDQMVQSLRSKAAEAGANGLISKGFTEAGYYQFKGGEGTAIWVARDSALVHRCPPPG